MLYQNAAQVSFILAQRTRLTDGQTDGRMDRMMDNTVRYITCCRAIKTNT